MKLVFLPQTCLASFVSHRKAGKSLQCESQAHAILGVVHIFHNSPCPPQMAQMLSLSLEKKSGIFQVVKDEKLFD